MLLDTKTALGQLVEANARKRKVRAQFFAALEAIPEKVRQTLPAKFLETARLLEETLSEEREADAKLLGAMSQLEAFEKQVPAKESSQPATRRLEETLSEENEADAKLFGAMSQLEALETHTNRAPARAIDSRVSTTGGAIMVEEDYATQLNLLRRRLAQKTITNRGTRFFPLLFAAPLAQAPESTIREWVKKKIKFGGRLIQTYTSPSNGLYISEDSIDRMANRFIKWRSDAPAGPAGVVTLGETDDQSGYIGLPDSARILGVDHHTAWRWITKGTSPLGRPLDVIKDPAAKEFYISEKDLSDLKNSIPRSGLRRGRRPRAQPIQP